MATSTSTSGDNVKLGSGINGIAENTLQTWQWGLDPGKRWMKADCRQSLKLCTAVLHVLRFLNFQLAVRLLITCI